MAAKKKKRGRRAARAILKHRMPADPCAQKGCHNRAMQVGHCRTCEAQVELGERDAADVYRLPFCHEHRDWGITAVRRHAMLKHPANIGRAVLAGLRGEL